MDDDHDDSFRPMFPHSSDPYNLNSKIMLTAIISLMIVVVLVVVLHIYARCVLGRHARRRAAIHTLSLRVVRLRSAEPRHLPKGGLDSAVIATLPVFKFKGAASAATAADPGEEALGPDCAVCLSFLEDEDMVRLLPNCSHIFHAECIDKWFSLHTTCPICRTDAKPQLRPEPREPPSWVPSRWPLPPLLDRTSVATEGTSDGTSQVLSKGTYAGSSLRFNSFRRMLSRERSSSQRIQAQAQDLGSDDDVEDIENLMINQSVR
ncbi:hypothetical protein SAY86_010680 [Trapa natans]|uniref:RING-type E3 ubiquitin transferase n=1 Tax=Trapa natans TaxID=22666 RepID=A0AAN7LVF6_TRANT|nr:hypothetical protein SAY86_010680 [Trapa natans]